MILVSNHRIERELPRKDGLICFVVAGTRKGLKRYAHLPTATEDSAG